MHIDKDGVCDACRVAEEKQNIDWIKRRKELTKLLDKYRSKNGDYDCIVPGGGKDSVYAAYVLKYEYGMNPLTVTWPPILYMNMDIKIFLIGSILEDLII